MYRLFVHVVAGFLFFGLMFSTRLHESSAVAATSPSAPAAALPGPTEPVPQALLRPGLLSPEGRPKDDGAAITDVSSYKIRIPIQADTVLAGLTFITVLPDSVGGASVERYVGQRLPVMSWVRGRSFFWRTRIQDKGIHELEFYPDPPVESGEFVRIQVVVL